MVRKRIPVFPRVNFELAICLIGLVSADLAHFGIDRSLSADEGSSAAVVLPAP